MKNAEKKIAAAIAAIELYLHDEAAALNATQEDPALVPANAPRTEPGFWSQSGRMDMMAARRMLQLRAFSRIR